MKKIVFSLPAFIVLLIILPIATVSAHKVVITVQNFSFSPASISNVVVGDTIRWEWIEGTHTTTSTAVPTGAASWNSPITSSNTFFEYKVTEPGVYNYKCNIHAAMGMVGTFTASVVTGITDITSVFGLVQLSPNPANEFVKLSFSPVKYFKGSVRLMNLLGRTIWRSDSGFDAGSNSLEISLANVTEGLYFIEIRDDMNNRAVKRLIVQ